MILDSTDINNNVWDFLCSVKAMFAPRRDKYNTGYICIATKGQFPLHDYEVGLLYVHVSCMGYGKGALCKPEEEIDPVNYIVLFTIGCADDGLWQALSKVKPKEECEKLVEQIKTEILDNLITLPTEQEMNEMLQPFGLFGTNNS